MKKLSVFKMDLMDFRCPITHQILLEPIVASDSHIYEKTAFEKWIKDNNISPFTGARLENKNYTKCFAISKMLEEYLKNNPKLRKEQFGYIKKKFSGRTLCELFEKNIDECIAYLNEYDNDEIKINKLSDDVYKNNFLIKKIIDKGIDLECEDNNKWRPIHYICRFSTPEMIKYIIDKGVDLECEDNNKWRPIHYICHISTPEMIKYIISKNVKIDKYVTKKNNDHYYANIYDIIYHRCKSKKLSFEEQSELYGAITNKI